ncbi:Protein of unknown function [Chitinophaga sp. YR573]|uniref:DUF3800 domain-containing protein n=1 Tax=Chitinophaga sp. YR573 TaxID=1881040 RepID=UPI0008BDC0AD|nr:DUF3800 domain-containing protein [Chitinophaga sp. YR573]SEW35769.1 Protein of unknown function [Chitinophaga sp. YR573]
MKLYIDESGNTGQVIIEEDIKRFKEQPVFALGGLLLENEEKENLLIKFIGRIKAKYQIQAPELKSKSIYESKPGVIKEFFKEFKKLDIPFFLEIMDKQYYLSIQLVNTFFLHSIYFSLTNDAFNQLRNLIADYVDQNLPESYYVDFCRICLTPSKEGFEQLFTDLCEYFDYPDNEVEELCLDYLLGTKKEYDDSIELDSFVNYLPLPDLDKKGRITSILPHTHAFSYLIARCEKYRVDNGLPSFVIVHDEQKYFDEILKITLDTMKKTQIDKMFMDSLISDKAIFKVSDLSIVNFENSKSSTIIQIADVITGFIMRAWQDFKSKDFKSLDRYKDILKDLIFNDTLHVACGVNFVVSQNDWKLFLKYLDDPQYYLL